MSVQENLKQVQARIRQACQRAARNPSEVQLILVTKNVPLEKIREAYEAGARDFGENRVQELLEKKPRLPRDIRWHAVGHLQTNKVKSVMGEINLLHSLDRVPLAEEIEKQAEKKNLRVDALIQVNTTGEAAKSGFAAEEVEVGVEAIAQMNRIQLRGLMTIGPTPGVASTAQDSIRAGFRRLRVLRDELQEKFPDLDFRQLSMGMSSDFEIAIEEGATLVRIGTAVFGERSPQSAVDSPQKEKDNGI